MLFGLIIIILLVIAVMILGNIRREEKEKFQLTAEYQRLQRENPEHDEAKMGLEEFILSRFSELRRSEKRNMWARIRFSAIGGITCAILTFIVVKTMPYDWSLITTEIVILSFVLGAYLGICVGLVTTFIKHGRPRLRVKTES